MPIDPQTAAEMHLINKEKAQARAKEDLADLHRHMYPNLDSLLIKQPKGVTVPFTQLFTAYSLDTYWRLPPDVRAYFQSQVCQAYIDRGWYVRTKWSIANGEEIVISKYPFKQWWKLW